MNLEDLAKRIGRLEDIEAIKQLKGNRGPRGLEGARGTTGAQGIQGLQGPPGPVVTTLPAGATERGMYSWADRTGAGYHPVVPLNFPFPLASAPTVNVIDVGGASTAACPGTSANPQAAPGNLCVYQDRNDGNQDFEVLSEVQGARFGAVLYFAIGADTDYEYEGTWAVTAATTAGPAGEPGHPKQQSN